MYGLRKRNGVLIAIDGINKACAGGPERLGEIPVTAAQIEDPRAHWQVKTAESTPLDPEDPLRPVRLVKPVVKPAVVPRTPAAPHDRARIHSARSRQQVI